MTSYPARVPVGDVMITSAQPPVHKIGRLPPQKSERALEGMQSVCIRMCSNFLIHSVSNVLVVTPGIRMYVLDV